VHLGLVRGETRQNTPDAQRFNSEMGTDFLERIAELASGGLSRLRP